MAKTIHESIDLLQTALADYIEATYHISDPKLVAQRKELLAQIGTIFQSPFLESTPRYAPGPRYRDIAGLGAEAVALFEALSTEANGIGRRIYDPPYTHQAEAIQEAAVSGKNLVIMTGTGSGKTESFLLPILAKLANEAANRPDSFRQPAVRALLLYPMNALVNDQLGRLRSLFDDPRVRTLFQNWSGRLPRFARYTSRTPYAGVRDKGKDGRRLKSFRDFYVDIEDACSGDDDAQRAAAQRVKQQLVERGKWPAKPDLATWYGDGEWKSRQSQEYQRAITLPNDAELVTRHEVQKAPSDLLVTNYSMLEYMMMRPIERPIFNATAAWLEANKSERFLVVLDEAHLYRGSSGAEVGLLLRRLRDRLNLTEDRFQVICATASFEDPDYALDFGAQLSGTPRSRFAPAIQGAYKRRDGEGDGTAEDAVALASVDLDNFFEGADESAQRAAAAPFLAHVGQDSAPCSIERSLHRALNEFAPLAKLVNNTMGKAQPVSALGPLLFPKANPKIADAATTALLALASRAKPEPSAPSLLPARVHTFFRGLSGLWVCMDPKCSVLPEQHRSGICGAMYAQPVERCGCDARVFEFFTCRNCGGAYARAYTDNIDEPSNLWSKPGRTVRLATGVTGDVLALDMLLEEPKTPAERASLDLDTGRLNAKLPERERTVYLRKDRLAPPVDEDGEEAATDDSLGQFVPCGLCGQSASFQRSSVQDHQTKGDQPFQALVSRQIQIQPPGPPTDPRFAPLRGRKVLVFSDSRQVAARLAPNLQMYSVRDALRPLIMHGLDLLQSNPKIARRINLDDAYLAAILAAKHLNVRLRPAMRDDETFGLDAIIEHAVAAGVLADPNALAELHIDYRGDKPPDSLIEDIYDTINDKFVGLEALALASVRERPGKTDSLANALPDIPGLAETPEQKIAVVRAWLRMWQRRGVWFQHSLADWWGRKVRGGPGRFPKTMNRLLRDTAQRKAFEKWLPILKAHLSDGQATPRVLARELSLELGGDWVRCPSCTSVHRPMPQTKQCLDCDAGKVVPLNPREDAVFLARKGYYRRAVDLVRQSPPEAPLALIAAEHTAQLNSPQGEDAFSKGEENEILFQDIDLNWRAGNRGSTAVDILSSTTTMEVGIDIGALSGVALRNMPPGRANYQQRAGRAGRRGNAVATVVAFGSADSHDEHYFTSPAEMISGPVTDPRLTLDNADIIKRHVLAFLLQNYHQERLPDEAPPGKADLFSVLGTVTHFRTGGSLLSRDDFVQWITDNQAQLRKRVEDWIPTEFQGTAREALLANIVDDAKASIDAAIGYGLPDNTPAPPPPSEDDEDIDPSPDGEDRGERNPQNGLLLERLLYTGVLPRYAFPTDVTTFRVFDHGASSGKYHVMSFAPSQGTPIALSQYAPGKQVWISGKCYTSGAIYSPQKGERDKAYAERKIYFECNVCRYAATDDDLGTRGDRNDCPACKSKNAFGEGMPWLRPVGFAHPYDLKEETSPDNVPTTSYATRAKLTMAGKDADWRTINPQLRALAQRTLLLVSNTGPKGDGYSYCTSCGRIEASAEIPRKVKGGTPHPKPFPTNTDEAECPGTFVTNGLVLGTKFITDVALFSMNLREPIRLRPGWYSTEVTLRTVSEALSKAACKLLEIEPGEILAEFRPGLSPGGHSGADVEIFLYDTLPGGGGFAPQLIAHGQTMFALARDLLASCPNTACDSSCYRCLRSFKNKFEHNLLDRHIGADFLDYILTGDIPAFDPRRIERSTHDLFSDLARLGDDRVDFEKDAPLSLGSATLRVPILATRRRDGARFAIGLACGLTPSVPESVDLQKLMSIDSDVAVHAVEELRVRANLPDATRTTLDALDL